MTNAGSSKDDLNGNQSGAEVVALPWAVGFTRMCTTLRSGFKKLRRSSSVAFGRECCWSSITDRCGYAHSSRLAHGQNQSRIQPAGIFEDTSWMRTKKNGNGQDGRPSQWLRIWINARRATSAMMRRSRCSGRFGFNRYRLYAGWPGNLSRICSRRSLQWEGDWTEKHTIECGVLCYFVLDFVFGCANLPLNV